MRLPATAGGGWASTIAARHRLSALVGTIDKIRATANPKLEMHGILRTMFDPRNNLANEVSSQLISHFGDRAFQAGVIS